MSLLLLQVQICGDLLSLNTIDAEMFQIVTETKIMQQLYHLGIFH